MKPICILVLLASSVFGTTLTQDVIREANWIQFLFGIPTNKPILQSVTFVVSAPSGQSVGTAIVNVLTVACASVTSNWPLNSCSVQTSVAGSAPSSGIVVHSSAGANYLLPANILSEGYQTITTSTSIASIPVSVPSGNAIWIEVGTSVTPCASVGVGTGACGN